MMILLSDSRVTDVPVREGGEPLVLLREFAAERGSALRCGASVLVREGLATRLLTADASLADGLALRVVEGYRAAEVQERIIEWYLRHLAREYPEASEAELRELSSRFVSPIEVAPHVAGAAVDVTVIDLGSGQDLDRGTAVDATPEDSGGRCYFDADDISDEARRHRTILANALTRAGFVNYPTEWWHWSYGDRYWAQRTGRSHALYGSVVRRGES